jgi:serine/threonine-protein kinase RsbW
MQSASISLIVDSRYPNVGLAGAAVNRICAGAGLPELECYHVELSVVEAVTNSIKHSYAGKPGHKVQVDIRVDEADVSFEVSDTGIPRPETVGIPRALEFDPKNLDTVPVGGMGLFIMHQVMDEVSYERKDGRNVTILRKYLVEQPAMAGAGRP